VLVGVAVGVAVGGGEPVTVGVEVGVAVGVDVGGGEPVGVGVADSAPMPGQKPAPNV